MALDRVKMLNAQLQNILDQVQAEVRGRVRDGELRQQSNGDYAGMQQYLAYTQQNIARSEAENAGKPSWGLPPDQKLDARGTRA